MEKKTSGKKTIDLTRGEPLKKDVAERSKVGGGMNCRWGFGEKKERARYKGKGEGPWKEGEYNLKAVKKGLLSQEKQQKNRY